MFRCALCVYKPKALEVGFSVGSSAKESRTRELTETPFHAEFRSSEKLLLPSKNRRLSPGSAGQEAKNLICAMADTDRLLVAKRLLKRCTRDSGFSGREGPNSVGKIGIAGVPSATLGTGSSTPRHKGCVTR
jgi:hypothetical protein